MNKILVTGASGHQGSAVVRQLRAKEHPVRVMLRDTDSDAARALARLGCELVPGKLVTPFGIDVPQGRVFGRHIRPRKLPWLLTRIFLGRQLTTLFSYFNRGKAPDPPDNSAFFQTMGSVTRFSEWLTRQRPPQ